MVLRMDGMKDLLLAKLLDSLWDYLLMEYPKEIGKESW